METVSDIFVSEKIRDIQTAVYGIEKDIPVLGLFCVCRGKKEPCRIEIMSHFELLKARNKDRYIIFGIGMGKTDACRLLGHMYEYALERGIHAADMCEIF